jgi:ArsR family transcriptional regulator, arsenate/arsenite/antimonite-responsive transcriptional repressor
VLYVSRQIYVEAISPNGRAVQGAADATRLRILGLLLTGEVCVCDIHQSLKIPQSKASRHLAYLRKSELVEAAAPTFALWYQLQLPQTSAGVH